MSRSALTAPVSELDFSPHTWKAFGKYLGGDNLNLGCGRNAEPGFVNVDRVPCPGVDFTCDLELGALNWKDGTFDFVLASHVLEHISNLIPLMREIHRVLKPGGVLAVVSPHSSSDDAWEDPTHVRAFTERSWGYWDRRLYEKPGHHGSYPSPIDFIFDVEEVHIIPQEDVMDVLAKHGLEGESALRFGHRFLRNIIREVHAVLRKVEG